MTTLTHDRPFAPPVLRRACSCGGTPGPSGECAACRRNRLQRSAASAGPAVAPPVVHDVLRSTGAPLDAGTRAQMEPRFGHSFADVRVHADGRAGESARAVGAHAYAVGRDVVFGAGRYAPGSADGDRLIAHELAHVVQQRGSASASLQPMLEVGGVDDPAEREADRAADAVTRGGPAHGLADGGGHGLRRSPAAAPDPDAALAWWSWMMGMGDLEAPTSFERHGLPEVTQVGGIEITRKRFSVHGGFPLGKSAGSAGFEFEDGKFRPFVGADPQADDADTMSHKDLPGWGRGFLPSVADAAPMPRMRAPRPLDPRQEGPREDGVPDQRKPWPRTPTHPRIGLGAAGLRFPAPGGPAVPPPMLDWTLADLRTRAARRAVSSPKAGSGAAELQFPLAHPASGIRRPGELP